MLKFLFLALLVSLAAFPATAAPVNESCSSVCTAEYLPVCGFDPSTLQYKSFPNKCSFNSFNCTRGWTLVLADMQECEKYESSQRRKSGF